MAAITNLGITPNAQRSPDDLDADIRTNGLYERVTTLDVSRAPIAVDGRGRSPRYQNRIRHDWKINELRAFRENWLGNLDGDHLQQKIIDRQSVTQSHVNNLGGGFGVVNPSREAKSAPQEN